MFKWLNKKSQMPVEHANIINGKFYSGQDLGTEDERNDVNELEDLITNKLAEGVDELDGHEFGEGGFTIYVYGEDASGMYEKIRDVLKSTRFQSLSVTLRFGPANDLNAREETINIY
jgi:translation elongation factor EF-1beta